MKDQTERVFVFAVADTTFAVAANTLGSEITTADASIAYLTRLLSANTWLLRQRSPGIWWSARRDRQSGPVPAMEYHSAGHLWTGGWNDSVDGGAGSCLRCPLFNRRYSSGTAAVPATCGPGRQRFSFPQLSAAVIEWLIGVVGRPVRLREDVERATAEVMRMSRLVKGLLVLAKADAASIPAESFDIRETILDRLEVWRPAAMDRGLTLRALPAGYCPVLASPGHLEQVLDNVLSNALEVSPSAGLITVGAQSVGDRVTLIVEDQGPGMSDLE